MSKEEQHSRLLPIFTYVLAAMFVRTRYVIAAAAVALTFSQISALMAAESERPNVVVIMTDNHGAWSLGCYGNPDIRTPNIDSMARQGLLFTQCHSSNAVCSPTRATFLTGLLPSQHGVHSWLAGGRLQMGENSKNTIEEFRSLPEILADEGYVCGLSGKWHLGDNLHPQEGFSFWVTKPHGATASLYRSQVIENGRVQEVEGYATEYWTQRGIEFIEANKTGPFFLFLAYNGPYGHSPPMARPSQNRHAAYYADKPLKSFPRPEVHPWLIHDGKLVGNIEALRSYASEVSGVDDGVGQIMATLKRLGLDEKTLLIFTADQGFACGHGGCWGMGAHTRPLTAYDWTTHIPLIFRHPGRVPPDRKSNLLISNYDLLPTVLAYLGLQDKIPDAPRGPGRDFSTVLLKRPATGRDDVVFYEYQNVRAIRTDEWKYIERFRQEPNELYHLANDPRERMNLIDQPKHATVQEQLHDRLHAFFGRYAEPQYDLWHDGKSKSRLCPTRR